MRKSPRLPAAPPSPLRVRGSLVGAAGAGITLPKPALWALGTTRCHARPPPRAHAPRPGGAHGPTTRVRPTSTPRGLSRPHRHLQIWVRPPYLICVVGALTQACFGKTQLNCGWSRNLKLNLPSQTGELDTGPQTVPSAEARGRSLCFQELLESVPAGLAFHPGAPWHESNACSPNAPQTCVGGTGPGPRPGRVSLLRHLSWPVHNAV